MKRLSILISATCLLFLAGCSNKTIYRSIWQSSPLSVGECNEFWFIDVQYNTKAKMLYSVSNDEQNLYVSLKVIDETVQRKIMLTGLTFWIDPNGKGKEQLGLTFPIEQPRQRNHGKINTTTGQQITDQLNSKADRKRFNDKYYNGMSEILISGFGGETEPRLKGNKSINGINAILRIDSLQTLYYEAQIPLKMIFNEPEEFLSNSTKYFSYAFETGYIEIPSTGSVGMASAMSGKGGSRGGGSRTGGSGRGQPSDMNSEIMATMQEMSQPSKFLVKKASLSNSAE